jgi:hypothetical protein
MCPCSQYFAKTGCQLEPMDTVRAQDPLLRPPLRTMRLLPV